MNWKKLFLVSILTIGVFLGLIQLGRACSDYMDPEYSRIFFFLPENSNLSGEQWWLCQTKANFYEHDDIPFEEKPSPFTADVDSVCQEWNVLLKENYPLRDIKKAVFESVLTNQGIELDSLDKGKREAEAVLEAIKEQPLLHEFLLLAKQHEGISVGYEEGDYEMSAEAIVSQKQAYAKAFGEVNSKLDSLAGNPLLQAKFTFLYLKWAAGSWDAKQAQALLERLEKGPSRTLESWGRLYLAELAQPGKERNVQLGYVVRNCPSKTTRCLQLFKPTENTDYIEQISDSSLQASLWALQAMHDYRPNKRYMERIVHLAPATPLLIDLVNREINKIEDQKYSKSLTGYLVFSDTRPAEEYRSSLDNLKEVLKKLKDLPQLLAYSKEFYTLSLAHISILDNQTEAGIALLQVLHPEYAVHKIQKNLSLLLHCSNLDLHSPANQEQIAKSIVEIGQYGTRNMNVNRCLSGVLLKLQQHFQAKGDWSKAGLCFVRSNMGSLTDNYFTDQTWLELNLNHQDFTQLEAVLEKDNKTAFEQLLADGMNIHDVYDSHARVYLRENNLPGTISYLKKLPVWYRSQKYNFLVETEVFFKGEMSHAVLGVIEALERLQAKVDKVEKMPNGNEKAKEYLSIATAYFELSNKGTYPFTTAYYSTNYAPIAENKIKARFPKALYSFYYKAEPSFAYFEKAKAQTKDKELSATIHYYQLRAYDKVFESQNDYKKLPKGDWMLYVKSFRETEFYRNHSCPAMEEYVGRSTL